MDSSYRLVSMQMEPHEKTHKSVQQYLNIAKINKYKPLNGSQERFSSLNEDEECAKNNYGLMKRLLSRSILSAQRPKVSQYATFENLY